MTERTYDPYADDPYVEPTRSPDQGIKKNALFTPFGIVVVLVALLMLGVVGWGIYQNSLEQPEEGPAPNFNLPIINAETAFTPDGEQGMFQLSDYKGQVVVINFWGSWCGPCRVEAPLLQRTYEAYQDQGVVFVGIAVKDIDTDAQAYIDEFNITYPNVMDVGAQIEKEYRIQGVPETFVVDKNGDIIKFFFAQPSERELRETIERALES